MKRFVFIIFIYLAHFTMSAQTARLAVESLDTKSFPTIKAKVYASDSLGNYLSNLTTTDFIVIENGKERVVTDVTCPSQKLSSQTSIALGIDISGSMLFSDTQEEPPIELVKTSVSELIHRFPLPPNEIAIQTCADDPYINIDFTDNRQRLLNFVTNGIVAEGANNFVSQLLDPNSGLFAIANQGKFHRTAVLLTDGRFNPLSNIELQRCIDTCTKYNIRFFAFIYGLPDQSGGYTLRYTLRQLAEATGGKVYGNILNEEQVLETVAALRIEIENEPCELTWESDNSCEINRQISIFSITNAKEKITSYTAPASSIVSLDIEPYSINLQGLNPTTPKDTMIRLTAVNSPITITQVVSSNPDLIITDYGGDVPPFTMQMGESRMISLRFSTPDSLRVFNKLIFENDKCDPIYCYVSGGFPGQKVAKGDLRVVFPNESNILVAGSDTTVSWEGIPLQDSAKLECSMDNGRSWRILDKNATNSEYRWHVPTIEADSCLIKISSYNKENNKDWIQAEIRPENAPYIINTPNRITVDENDNSYMVGSLIIPLDLGRGIILAPPDSAANDCFIAKYSPDGIILWAKKIIAKKTNVGLQAGNRINDVKTDHLGNIYIAGQFKSPTLDFGNGVIVSQHTMNDQDLDAFVAKYDEAGEILWAKSIGGTGLDIINTMIVAKNGSLYLGGSTISHDLNIGDNKSVSNNTTGQLSDCFIIKYDTDGNAQWGKVFGAGAEENLLTMATDGFGNLYAAGYFISKTFSVDSLTPLINSSNINLRNSFIIKYDAQDKAIWAKKIGESSDDAITGIQIGKKGDIFLRGYLRQAITLKLNNGEELRKNYQDDRMEFLAKLDSNTSVEWAKFLPSFLLNFEPTFSLSSDDGIIFCGLFDNAINFGNGVRITTEDYDYKSFVAKYHSDGRVLWAKKIRTSTTFSIGHGLMTTGVAIDGGDNLYVCGASSNKDIDFDNGTVLSTSNGGIFIGKYAIGSLIEQRDTSDRVSRIVKPKAEGIDIDMGTAIIASSRDSLVQGFITNTGDYPIRIDSIQITGEHYSDFQLLSGIPPYTIEPGAGKAVEFRFTPSETGDRLASIQVITQIDTIVQSIRGEGRSPNLRVISLIDFGTVTIGEVKDTVVALMIQNISSQKLNIEDPALSGPDVQHFEIVGGGKFELEPGQTHSISLRFAPMFRGRTSSRLQFNYSESNDPVNIKLFGRGNGGGVGIKNDSAYSGQRAEVKIILSEINPLTVAQYASSFKIRLAFSNIILTPVLSFIKGNSTLLKGATIDTLEVHGQLHSDTDELIRIPVVAIHGDKIATEIELIDFDWMNDKGQIVLDKPELLNGIFTVRGEFANKDKPKDDRLKVTINPMSYDIEVAFKTVEEADVKLSVMDILGRRVALMNNGFPIGQHVITLPTTLLTSGIYHITLETPTQFYTESVILVK